MYDEIIKKCFKCREPRLFKVHRSDYTKLVPVHWRCLGCYQRNDSTVVAKALNDED